MGSGRRVKGSAEKMRKLRADLRYWQQYGRIYRRWVRDADEKCKEIAQKMRELKNENGKTTIPGRLHENGIQVQGEKSKL